MGGKWYLLGNQNGRGMLRPRPQSGLTLIEMMIVIAVIALLMTTGVPSFSKWIQNRQIRTAAEAILNGLQLARSEAVKQNSDVKFELLGQSSGWEVSAASVIQSRPAQEGTANVTVTPCPGLSDVVWIFNGFGRVKDFEGCSDNKNIETLSIDNPNGDRPLSVRITQGGSVRLCDPSPKLQAGDPRAC